MEVRVFFWAQQANALRQAVWMNKSITL